ncbi:hypothetical protein E2320_022112, partial [Naja naja]
MIGLPLLLLLLLLFWLLPPSTAKKIQTVCLLPKHLKTEFQWELYSSGDLIIGGNLPRVTFVTYDVPDFQKNPSLLPEEIFQGDRRIYPSFFWINPKESAQCEGLVQLLLHFQWNWVGLMANEDDGGEHFISSLILKLKEKEICLAFTEVIKFDFTMIKYSSFANFQIVRMADETHTSLLKVWIFTSNWKFNVMSTQYMLPLIQPYHGALHFRDHAGDVSEFSHFLMSLDPFNPQGDFFLPL